MSDRQQHYFNSAGTPTGNKEWFRIVAKGEEETEVMLYDDIGMWGTTARDFVEKLNEIETDKISVRINSYGGEVADGIAIYNALKNHGSNITCYVDGIAASIASVIALGGKKVCIAPNAFMMIHNPWSMAAGDAKELRKQADVLDMMAEQLAGIYSEASGKSADEVKAAMDAETWFNADAAEEFGLVDEVMDEGSDEEVAAAAQRALAKFKKVPHQLRRIAAKFTENKGAGVSDPIITKAKEAPVAHQIYARDGKHFIKVGDKEIEVDAPAASAPAAPNSQDAINAAVQKDRECRGHFNTVVAAAGITGKAAEEFEKRFFDRFSREQMTVDDVKFYAQETMAGRAKPVGEGGGEEAPKNDAAKEEAEVREFCAKRFAKEPAWRSQMGCLSSNPEDPRYKAALDKYVKLEMKNRTDQKLPKASSADKEDGEDAISRIMKNKSAVEFV